MLSLVIMTTTIVLLKKESSFCEHKFSTFQKGRQHVFNMHGKNVHSRKQNDQKKKKKDVFIYNAQNAVKYSGALIKYPCITCIASFVTKDDYGTQVNYQHIIK